MVFFLNKNNLKGKLVVHLRYTNRSNHFTSDTHKLIHMSVAYILWILINTVGTTSNGSGWGRGWERTRLLCVSESGLSITWQRSDTLTRRAILQCVRESSDTIRYSQKVRGHALILKIISRGNCSITYNYLIYAERNIVKLLLHGNSDVVLHIYMF